MNSIRSPNRSKRKARKKKSIACRRCHAQKIKCSGEQPCIKCQRSGHAADCIYPSRDKIVKVTKSYLDSVVADNRRLLEQLASLQGASVRGVPSQAFSLSTSSLDHEDIQIKNPLVGDKAWFQTYKSSLPPIYIGEAACTAFASRLHQLLAGDSSPSHITRVEYTKDAVLSTAAKSGTPWPDLGQAQLLVRIALNHLSKTYHVVLKHDALDGLEKVYQTVQFDDPTREAHYFVLFALGQAHSAPTARSDQLPGLEYYAQALDLMRTRPERSSLVYIETLVLLALFSFLLDRRHTGYVLISDAMRYGVTLGLHHTLPESQLSGPIEREHRIRLWWTLYILDRDWSVKLGFPIHLSDADISVDMPSAGAIHQSSELHSAQFPEDTRHFMARIHHARIVGEIASNIYSLRQFKESFLHRVQRSLQMLHDWMQSLLQDTDIGSQLLPKSMVDLHLSFNQAIILTTRPILFFLLTRTMSEQRMHPGLDTTTVTKSPTIPTPLIQLGQVCIQAARSSYTLLIDQWTAGQITMISPAHAHWLFSTALVLAVSSQINAQGDYGTIAENNLHCQATATNTHTHMNMDTDIGGVQIIMDILRTMAASGNLPAAEYLRNLEAVWSAVIARQEHGRTNLQPRSILADPLRALSTTTTTLGAVAAALESLNALHACTSAPIQSGAAAPATSETASTSAGIAPSTQMVSADIAGKEGHGMNYSQAASLHQAPPPQHASGAPSDPFHNLPELELNNYEEIDDALVNWNLTGPLWVD